MSKTLEKEVDFLRKKTVLLSQENSSLHEENLHLKTLLEERQRHFQAEYDLLLEAHKKALRDRFGKKSERFVDEQSGQGQLFETTEDSAEKKTDVEETLNPEDIETITYTRKKRGAKKSEIPTREVIIEMPESERICACGNRKEMIRYETSSRLNYVPAILEIVIEKREVCACRKGCDGSVATAPKPPQILPKCKATESLLSYIAVSKVLDRQPLYHLEKSIQQRYDWHIPRQTMARWMIQLSDKLMPLINLMKEQLIEYDIAAIDATTLHVLNEPNKLAETKSFAYCLRGGPPGKEVILYEYNAYLATPKDYVTETFLGFEGTIHCDASPVFNGVASQKNVQLSYCHAHARRKFEQILKANKGKHPLSKEALQMYQDLYKVERLAKEEKMSPDQRFKLRLEKSEPILTKFHHWLIINKEKTFPKSPIGLAIAYTLNQWKGLQVFLTDGRLEIDNNATERDIKPFVIARKNFLFVCTQEGADALGVHFSLILTARLHGLNPLDYYTQILQQIPYCDPASLDDYEKFLPWNFKKELI